MTALWFWIDAKNERASPCGAVITDESGKVIGGARWFEVHWRGRFLNDCIRASRAKWVRLSDWGRDMEYDYIDVHAVAERLLSLREAKGISAVDLADAAGVPDSVVRRAEKGSISLVNLQKITFALGADLHFVTWGKP